MAFNPDKCLKFKALANNCTINMPSSLVDNSPYYLSKNGEDWVQRTITLSNGETCFVKGTQYPAKSSGAAKFTFSAPITIVSGNIMSLVDDGAGELTEITQEYGFQMLFYNQANLISMSEGVLSATTLASNCYNSIFYGCAGLISLPENLSLAKNLARQCYRYAFSGCTGLTTLPKNLLSATTLTELCYQYMFEGCTNLTTVPKDCFKATTLANNSCLEMFSGCTKLNEIHVSFTQWSPAAATSYWLTGVATSGDFYCPEELPEKFGSSNIPTGWTVHKIKQPEIGCTINFLNKLKIGGHIR